MTFEEWAEENEIDHERHDYSIGLAQMAWIAATKETREACAKVCDDVASTQRPGNGQVYKTATRCRRNILILGD